MSEATHHLPAHTNPAVARCCAAWDRAREQARINGKGEVFAALDAAQAYRLNLPDLDSFAQVRDFISCVAQGLLLGAITGADAARLIYAAQVAGSSLRAPAQEPRAAGA